MQIYIFFCPKWSRVGYNPNIFSGAVYAPLSVSDCPSPAYNIVSSTDYPDPEILSQVQTKFHSQKWKPL